jgi:uncharacterized protein
MTRALRFAGYAALFERTDKGGDRIAHGAFRQALSRLAGQCLPLLWQHKTDSRIGIIEHVQEDDRGLRVIGRIEDAPGLPRDAIAALKSGRVIGLSFGYRVRSATGVRPRHLLSLDIAEVSLVTHPMQPQARVHAIE